MDPQLEGDDPEVGACSIDVGPAAVHKKYAEFFYVVDGSATLVTGGKLANEKSNGDNLSGTAIEGGSPRQVAKMEKQQGLR